MQFSLPPLFTRKPRRENSSQRQHIEEPSPFATLHYRRPTFTYSPPACRRFYTLPRSMAHSPASTTSSYSGSPSSIGSTPCALTPDSEALGSPTTSYFPPMPEFAPASDTAVPATTVASQHAQPERYVSFPDLDTLSDDCWVDVRVERKDWGPSDLQMEGYDEMLVGGVRLAYS